MSGKKTDNDQHQHDPRHDKYSSARFLHPAEYDAERNIEDHDLYRKPHLVIYEEQSEERADDFHEAEMGAVLDIVHQRIRQIDIVTDKERHEHREDPSLHEALGVVLVGHPSFHKSESGREEEESDRENTVEEVMQEFLHLQVVHTEVKKRYDGLMEDNEQRKEALDLFTQDPVEERRFLGSSSFRIQDQDRSQES